jgi:hypothetical protein
MMTARAKWVLLRLIAPLAVGGAVTVATWGHRYFDVLTPLAWSLFIVHALVTFAFRRTHLLDTGSFFCLIFGCVGIAELSEARQVDNMRAWSIVVLICSTYAFLSFVGRRRADRMTAQHNGVSLAQVIGAVLFLLVATIVCAASKTAVGFLFVPGLLLVPVILLFALLRRESSRADNRNT